MPFCNVNLLSFHQEVNSISPPSKSGRGHATCFDYQTLRKPEDGGVAEATGGTFFKKGLRALSTVSHTPNRLK